jgi:hypothetical protein
MMHKSQTRQQELHAIKHVPMTRVLERLNIECTQSGGNTMFRAVWRGEQRASVSIRQAADGVWVFVDHGCGKKGTNIDLVMLANEWPYRRSIQWLRTQFVGSTTQRTFFSFPKPTTPVSQGSPHVPNAEPVSGWKILAVKPVGRFLHAFERERTLKRADLRSANIQELHLLNPRSQKRFWIAGHQNLQGGWELFSPYPGRFKTCIAPKGFSWVKGNVNILIVAESMIDAVSAKKMSCVHADLLSLNSTRLAKRAGLAFRKRKRRYDRIILALDNDAAGRNACEVLKSYLCEMGSIEEMTYDYGSDPSEELIAKAKNLNWNETKS